MKMTHVEIPNELLRNSPRVLALGIENTGMTILNEGNKLLGCPDLSDKDVLDIGCGTRFTQTIINRGLPIKSYTGIDIDEYLIHHISNKIKDERFSFYYWDIYNEIYNPFGPQKLTKHTKLPLPQSKKFDVIWIYSVVTHNYPEDTTSLLHILRQYIKKDGRLLFSAFLDDDIATFEYKQKDEPLANVAYSGKFLRKIISKTGWDVEKFSANRPDLVTQNMFLCKPKRRFWEIF